MYDVETVKTMTNMLSFVKIVAEFDHNSVREAFQFCTTRTGEIETNSKEDLGTIATRSVGHSPGASGSLLRYPSPRERC